MGSQNTSHKLNFALVAEEKRIFPGPLARSRQSELQTEFQTSNFGRPFFASLVLHAAVLLGVLVGVPKVDRSWKQLDVKSGIVTSDAMEVAFLPSLSQDRSKVSSPTPRREAVSQLKVANQESLKAEPNASASLLDTQAASASVSDDAHISGGAIQISNGDVADSHSNSSSDSIEARYLSEIRSILNARKEYPIAARRMGHSGRVEVRFVLERSGRIQKAEIIKSSHSEILNRAARTLLESLKTVKPFPNGVNLTEWAVVVPIEYQL